MNREQRPNLPPGAGFSLGAVPLLPMRDTVVFPSTVATALVGQERSIKLVNHVLSHDKVVALVTQRNAERVAQTLEDVHRIGTLATLHQAVQAQDGALRIIVHGLERIRLRSLVRAEPFILAEVERAPELEEGSVESEGLARTARELFARMVSGDPELPDDLVAASRLLTDTRALAYLIASSLPLPTARRQEVLELESVETKLRTLIDVLQHEVAVRQVVQRVTAATTAQISKAQREHVLRTHLESIQKELGELEPEATRTNELRAAIARVPLSKEAREEAETEVERLERIPTISPEHAIITTYLDWLLKLPWGTTTGTPIDVARAREVLDEDHFDLDKIKERILEYLAVKRLREARQDTIPSETTALLRAEPILCFVGPPGVGKTSLGRSIARAMGRAFAHVSLGGTHDEAEIRGHRRTYVGAMPGRILQALARAGAADPVFMLDECDKLGVGFHGDPAAALLEVLDPAQNHTFVDNYLGVAFDLSRVLFIGTANTTDPIPPALLDRMEVVRLAGYTEIEKLFIATRFLLPHQLQAHALRKDEVIVDDDAIRRIIHGYTREAGVRNLEREVAAILRKVARRIGDGESAPITVTAATLTEFLGPERHFGDVRERVDRTGVATGMAWTAAGGEILFVEATIMPADEERVILTGMLGEVMRESAHAALSYLRTNARRFGIYPELFEHKAIHVHVPASAIPKDGPSAGVTILAALTSVAAGRPVRNDLAMTGEITLRGKVLPVAGIKEKVLAAHRAGIGTVLLPRRNEGALEDIPEEVRRAIRIILVDSADEVLEEALGIEVEPLPSTQEALAPPSIPPSVH
jgi:ATP-dependent Lon protease